MLDEKQLDKLADILIYLGTLFFGATVTPLLVGVDKIPLEQVLLGVTLSLVFWIVAVRLVNKRHI